MKFYRKKRTEVTMRSLTWFEYVLWFFVLAICIAVSFFYAIEGKNITDISARVIIVNAFAGFFIWLVGRFFHDPHTHAGRIWMARQLKILRGQPVEPRD
jgi:flagellar biogenesis protein FliO